MVHTGSPIKFLTSDCCITAIHQTVVSQQFSSGVNILKPNTVSALKSVLIRTDSDRFIRKCADILQ